MNEIQTQTQKILRFMEAGNAITGMEALTRFGCMRLQARIADLKKAGVPIVDEWVYKTDETGKVVKKWKRYRIEGTGARESA